MLDVDQVAALAPDDRALKAAKKTATPAKWSDLGTSERALWGLCSGSGSGRYQVRVDLKDLAVKCSCPSRKIPCKHALALMLLAARGAAAIPTSDPPDWTTSWLQERDARAQKKVAAAAAKGPPDEGKRTKRQAKRGQRVEDGLAQFKSWLLDLGRLGVASLERWPESIEEQAARLVDAHCGGLAARLRGLADDVGRTEDWPATVLRKLGRLALVVDAYERRDELPEPLVHDLRTRIGFTMTANELAEQGEVLDGRFEVLGQSETEGSPSVRGLRTWLGSESLPHPVAVLQFAGPGRPFTHRFAVGTSQHMKGILYPSAFPLRVSILSREGVPEPIGAAGLARATSPDAFLSFQATALAANPFLELVPCALRDVVPVGDSPVMVADGSGRALPLTPGSHWRLVAASGGHPVDLFGQWDGTRLRPLLAYTADGPMVLA